MLLDVRMASMSGLAMFEKLIAYGLLPTLPVLFLTGHADVPTAVDAVKRGAFDFCEKPFSDNALVDRIEQALRQSASALAQHSESNGLRRKLQADRLAALLAQQTCPGRSRRQKAAGWRWAGPSFRGLKMMRCLRRGMPGSKAASAPVQPLRHCAQRCVG